MSQDAQGGAITNPPADGQTVTAPAATEGAQSAAAEQSATPTQQQPQEPVTPEAYDLKLPDGSLLDPASVEKVTLFAKENKLSQEAAQALLQRENEVVSSFVTKAQADFKAQTEQWVKDIQGDKEVGGEKFKENIELAHRVLKRFGSDDFSKALEETGYGNHPDLVKVFVRIGKAMGDDKAVIPGAQAGEQKSLAQLLYPTNK